MSRPAPAAPTPGVPNRFLRTAPPAAPLLLADATSPEKGRGQPSQFDKPIVVPWRADAPAPNTQIPDVASGKTGGPNEFRSNRGAFDISVKVAPRSKAPGNRDGGPAQGALTQTVIAPGLWPSAPVNVDRLLVTVNAVPAADHARVENGAVVLAASPNAQSNSQSGNGNG